MEDLSHALPWPWRLSHPLPPLPWRVRSLLSSIPSILLSFSFPFLSLFFSLHRNVLSSLCGDSESGDDSDSEENERKKAEAAEEEKRRRADSLPFLTNYRTFMMVPHPPTPSTPPSTSTTPTLFLLLQLFLFLLLFHFLLLPLLSPSSLFPFLLLPLSFISSSYLVLSFSCSRVSRFSQWIFRSSLSGS